VEEPVGVPELAADPEAEEDLDEADLALLAALTLELALALAVLPLGVGVAIAAAVSYTITLPHQPSGKLTTANVPDDGKRILAQTCRPATKVALAAARTRRRDQHSRVAEALVAAQTGRLREEGASRAGGPKYAVRARAALRERARRGQCRREVA